jgi:enamine deaminase RidA (YjgF/YER057c/UK114 family)
MGPFRTEPVTLNFALCDRGKAVSILGGGSVYILRGDSVMLIEEKIKNLGLYLPASFQAPSGVAIDFAWARVFDDRVYVSGHAPQAEDGMVLGPFGRVGAEVTPEQAVEAARLATLSVLASVKRAIDDLDRITAWLRIESYILVAPGFDRTTNVANGCSRLISEIFGSEIGRHARTAMGVAATPLSCPVVVAAELAFQP